MNYPTGTKKAHKISINKNIDYKNRGMSLEEDLNITNEYYRNIDKAYIYKKPTPIKLVKVDYRHNKVTEGYFDTPSTTDYNGIYKGKYIDFEAKETTSKTSFPLSNIHKHQLVHLENIKRHQGISFLIVRFSKLNETYLLREEELEFFLRNYDKKSIPISFFKEKGYLIKDKYTPRVDYLEVLDKLEVK